MELSFTNNYAIETPAIVQGVTTHQPELTDNVILVGLGPHAKRIYVHYLKSMGIEPKVVVELESVLVSLEAYLKSELPNSEAVCVDPHLDYENTLPLSVKSMLDEVCSRNNITHAIVATEPKSHACYLKYFIEKSVHILCDKPLTSPRDVCTNIVQADKIKTDFESVLKQLEERSESQCVIQCQRRWHPGYIFIRETLNECISKFQIPITNLEVYHCDGMWNMPNEFYERENHPYKYGYGKLMHSGYHFVDLICWLVELNDQVSTKTPNNCELYATATKANDFFNIIKNEDYRNILGVDHFADHLSNRESAKGFGEIDVQALFQLKQDDSVFTTCSLNLLQNGFSRRSWDSLPNDTYKGNGRVRHERVNIQIGPLLNIQVHSYQAIEVKERGQIKGVGGVEHFEIYIFRNVDLIGGQAFEKLTLDDLTLGQFGDDFIGYNELARKKCIQEFLNTSTSPQTSLLGNHQRSIEVLTQIYRSLAHRHNQLSSVMNFDWLP